MLHGLTDHAADGSRQADVTAPVHGLRWTVSSTHGRARTHPTLDRIADELSRPVLDHALTFAERHANIDELFEAHRAWNLQQYDTGDPREKAVWEASAFEHEHSAIPAWLAATGRLDESRQALADYLGTERPYARSKEYARYAQRLIQWLDAHEQPPPAPPRT
jgi:hypothetical protein